MIIILSAESVEYRIVLKGRYKADYCWGTEAIAAQKTCYWGMKYVCSSMHIEPVQTHVASFTDMCHLEEEKYRLV